MKVNHLGDRYVLIESDVTPKLNQRVRYNPQHPPLRIAHVVPHRTRRRHWIAQVRASAHWTLQENGRSIIAIGTEKELRSLVPELGNVDTNTRFTKKLIETALHKSISGSVRVVDGDIRHVDALFDTVIHVDHIADADIWSICMGVIRVDREEL